MTNSDDAGGGGSRLASSSRWSFLILGVLGMALVICWGAALLGGPLRVRSWLWLQSLVGFLGIFGLLFVLVRGTFKRRFGVADAALLGASVIAIWPLGWGFNLFPVRYPARLESTRPQLSVRLPSEHRVRVLWGGDFLARNYHAFVPNQRWAYDLGIEPVLTMSARLQDYGCYGTPVLAPVSATVGEVRDGLPDNVPGKLSMNFKAPEGNFVALQVSGGALLILAHMQPGSITVRAGDKVREGEMLGHCGNSGNTSEPHIHIHLQRAPPSGKSLFLAEGLPLFFRDIDGPAMPQGGFRLNTGQVELLGDVLRPLSARSDRETE